MKAREILFRFLVGLPLFAAGVLTMWLIGHLPMYFGLLPLVPWAIVWAWLKVVDPRRARRRQQQRVTPFDPDRWKWN
jgi:uncharacterized membrane protein